MQSFSVGDRVHIASLGAGVVREARNGGRYLIEIKGRTMVVAGSELEAVLPERGSRKKAPTAGSGGIDPREPAPPRAAAASLDLHGKTVLDALDALDTFLNDAILDGREEVRIIHGRGGGRLKAAVHARLAELSAVRAYRMDPANPGVTMVVL